ncbi:MAG TPA: hypothetical protein VGR45_00905 [Stellaceae bacterium]|nr:hypothetical protein [Stellaceae bacterium]
MSARPSDHIWALVSGLPSGERERRLFMVLQGWVDVSGNEPQGGPVIVFGGFVAPYEMWSEFADEWDKELAREPKLEYFKMSEANSLNGEFHRRRGWNEELRDERVLRFARIIPKYARIRVSAWLRHQDWIDHIVSIPAPVRRLSVDHPYGQLFMQIILATAAFQDTHALTGPCDFIFDEELTFSDEVMQWWPQVKDWIRQNGRSDLIKFLGSPPIFRNEKAFKPLQAADLYAWQVRNRYLESRQAPRNQVLQMLWPIGAINREVSTAEIIRLREHLLEAGKRFIEDNPNVTLLPPIEDKKERQRAHRAARQRG